MKKKKSVREKEKREREKKEKRETNKKGRYNDWFLIKPQLFISKILPNRKFCESQIKEVLPYVFSIGAGHCSK
jgi:hypothetical protein